MTAHDLFAHLSIDQADEVLGWLHDQNRNAYRTCAGMLAARRKLRPVFVERKPREERHAWMKNAFARPTNNDIATEILQTWILGAHEKMICDFLETLGVSHDGKGLVETFPAEPPAADVARAVDGIFQNHPRTAVVIYLNLFIGMKIADWPELEKMVSSDPRLCPESTPQTA